MAESIFSKIRLATLGNLHQLLNKMVDLNSVAAVEQYLRDIENALDDLKGQAAEAEGRKRYVVRERDNKLGVQTGVETSIKALLTDNNPANDHLATAMAVKVMGIKQSLAMLDDQVREATDADSMIDQAVSQLEAKGVSLQNQLEHLRLLDESTKAKERGAAALTAAAHVMNTGDGINVDSVAARIEERAATAGVKLEQALGSMNTASAGDAQMGEAEAYLAQMRAQLGITEKLALPAQETTYRVVVEEAAK